MLCLGVFLFSEFWYFKFSLSLFNCLFLLTYLSNSFVCLLYFSKGQKYYCFCRFQIKNGVLAQQFL